MRLGKTPDVVGGQLKLFSIDVSNFFAWIHKAIFGVATKMKYFCW